MRLTFDIYPIHFEIEVILQVFHYTRSSKTFGFYRICRKFLCSNLMRDELPLQTSRSINETFLALNELCFLSYTATQISACYAQFLHTPPCQNVKLNTSVN